MVHCHIVLPSAAAAAFSVGVVTKNRGDLPDEAVNSRTVAFDVVVVPDKGTEIEVNGKGMSWIGRREMADRICTTVVGMNVGCACVELPGAGVSMVRFGTEPGGRVAKI